MKQVLFAFFLLSVLSTYAQVPKQHKNSEGEGEIGSGSPGRYSDMDVSTDMPRNKKAPDEVSSIYFAEGGKRGFVMGDNSKKTDLYDEINFTYGSNNYIVKKGNLYGMTNNKGQIVVKIAYDSIAANPYKVVGYIVKQKEKYGIISATGEIMLPLKYNKVIAGNKDITLVKNGKNETQLIFNVGNKAFPGKIDYAEIYQNLTVIKSGGKFGVVKNKVIVPIEYDSIFLPISNNYNTRPNQKMRIPNPSLKLQQDILCLALQKDNKFGLVDNDGELLFSVDNDEVHNAENFGYFSVKKGNYYGIYFSKSKEKKKTKIEFDRISTDGYGAIMASKNKKTGIFTFEGEQITEFEYDNDLFKSAGNTFRVSKDKKRGLIDKQGKVIIPLIYDDISPFYGPHDDLFQVKLGEKFGAINLKGEIVIPIEFEHINELNGNYLVVKSQPLRKIGLIDKGGNIIVPVENKWITRTATEDSNILVINKEDDTFNFFDNKNKVILPENITDYGYIIDQLKLKSPIGRHELLYVKTKEGKTGLLNEISGKLDIPAIYDEILQCTSNYRNIYFSVRKGKKYGLINEKNEIILPIIYDAINLDFAVSLADQKNKTETDYENNLKNSQVIVAKGKKFGTVNLKNEQIIPFQYSALDRISLSELFKAKTGKKYQIIDKDGKLINKNTFDEVANFENIDNDGYGYNNDLQSLTFSNGKMRVINDKGNFISSEKTMQPHIGYKTFDELKFALIKALDSKDDVLLKEFASNISPSEQILYYLKQNLFDKSVLYTDIEWVKEKYFKDLLKFKNNEWNVNKNYEYSGYKRSSIDVVDYTLFSKDYGMVTNARTTDKGYGDRFMEKLLRDAVKVNGYWISTYFMTRGFQY